MQKKYRMKNQSPCWPRGTRTKTFHCQKKNDVFFFSPTILGGLRSPVIKKKNPFQTKHAISVVAVEARVLCTKLLHSSGTYQFEAKMVLLFLNPLVGTRVQRPNKCVIW